MTLEKFCDGGKELTFSPEFERDVLTAMIRHPDVFNDYQEIIQPKVFGIPAYRKLWFIMQEFYRDHRELPTLTSMIELIADRESEGFFLSEDMEYILDNIDPIMNGTPVNEQFVLDRLIGWVKDKRLRAKITQAIRGIEKGDADISDVIRMVKEAEVTSEILRQEEEEDFAAKMMEHVLNKRLNPRANIIPTGIPVFDGVIGGGPKRGYKCIIMGPPGGGKTTTSLQICGSAVEQGLGAYYLFNDDTDYEMYDRFISHFSYIPTNDIVDDTNQEELETLQNKLLNCRGELGLRFIDTDTTPSQVRRLVEKRIETGHKVDVLVVDHLRNMRADEKGDSGWQDIGNIWLGLMQLAIDFDLVLYAIMHTNREAEGRSSINNSHLGLSYEPVKDANLIVAVWRCREDTGSETHVRMQITKHRGGPGLGCIMRFEADFERMRLRPGGQIVHSQEELEGGIYDPSEV